MLQRARYPRTRRSLCITGGCLTECVSVDFRMTVRGTSCGTQRSWPSKSRLRPLAVHAVAHRTMATRLDTRHASPSCSNRSLPLARFHPDAHRAAPVRPTRHPPHGHPTADVAGRAGTAVHGDRLAGHRIVRLNSKTRRQARTGILTTLGQGLEATRDFDAIVAIATREGSVAFAAWQSARQIEQGSAHETLEILRVVADCPVGATPLDGVLEVNQRSAKIAPASARGLVRRDVRCDPHFQTLTGTVDQRRAERRRRTILSISRAARVLSWCSQNLKTFQPALRKKASVFLSRAMLLSILARHHAPFAFGQVP